MERAERKHNFIEYLISHYSYYSNMVEIGKFAVRFGKSPEQFNVPQIRNLCAGMYSVDVMIGSCYGGVNLLKKDPSQLGDTPFSRIPNSKLEICSDGKIEAYMNVLKEPIARNFEKPGGRNSYFEFEDFDLLTINSLANKLCPKTQKYFTDLTTDALEIFKATYPSQDVQSPITKQNLKSLW
jgi:hypothetical protein